MKKIMKSLVVALVLLMVIDAAHSFCYSYSTEFEPIADDLYEKDGELLFKTYSMCNESKETRLAFIHTFHDLADLAVPGKKLTEVVDKDTWEKVAGFIYRDKNHVYFHTTSVCGGYLYIKEGLKPEKITYLYSNELITPSMHEDIKREKERKIRTLEDVNYYISTGSSILYLYSNAQTVSEDVENFEVELGDGYDAKDSKHYYSRGNIVGDIEKE